MTSVLFQRVMIILERYPTNVATAWGTDSLKLSE